jgi:hypothetical protein
MSHEFQGKMTALGLIEMGIADSPRLTQEDAMFIRREWMRLERVENAAKNVVSFPIVLLTTNAGREQLKRLDEALGGKEPEPIVVR